MTPDSIDVAAGASPALSKRADTQALPSLERAKLPRSACVVLIFVGLSVSLGNFVLPALVGIFQDGFGFTLSQSGFLATAYMSGGGVGAIALTVAIVRARTAWLLGSALVTVATGYLLVSVAESFALAFAAMSIAGLGEGAALALMAGGLSRAKAPDRMYGLFVFLAITAGAVSFTVIPLLASGIGVHALFVVFALVPAAALLFTRVVPDLRRPADASQAKPGTSSSLARAQRVMFVVGLTAALCIYTAKGGFWTYLDRIGVSIGLDVALVSRILAIGSIAGAAGAAFAAFLNSRWGRARPVLICLLVQAITLTIAVRGESLVTFAAAVIAFYFIWYFFIANLLGLMSAADSTGRLVSALLAAQTIGLAIGPAIAAMVVSEKDFSAIVPLGLGAYALAALLLLPVLRAARQR